jgi:hypothetical protein
MTTLKGTRCRQCGWLILDDDNENETWIGVDANGVPIMDATDKFGNLDHYEVLCERCASARV